MTTPDEYSEDLFWHALNYRTASIANSNAMWQELAACVLRKIDAAVVSEREACAKVCEGLWGIDGSFTADEFAREVRARGQQ